jgi:hypothetical protein
VHPLSANTTRRAASQIFRFIALRPARSGSGHCSRRCRPAGSPASKSCPPTDRAQEELLSWRGSAGSSPSQTGQVSGPRTTSIRLCNSAHNSFGIVVITAKVRTHSPAGERQFSHNPASAIKSDPRGRLHKAACRSQSSSTHRSYRPARGNSGAQRNAGPPRTARAVQKAITVPPLDRIMSTSPGTLIGDIVWLTVIAFVFAIVTGDPGICEDDIGRGRAEAVVVALRRLLHGRREARAKPTAPYRRFADRRRVGSARVWCLCLLPKPGCAERRR